MARVGGALRFPSDVLLVLAMNPCPCGHAGHPTVPCRCAPAALARYAQRMGGPLADRIDLHVTLAPVPPSALAGTGAGDAAAPREGTATWRPRIAAARARQQARFGCVNARVPAPRLLADGVIGADARAFLADAATRLALSARAFHRVLRVARTIADLAGDEAVGTGAVAEALRYRPVRAIEGERMAPIVAAPSPARPARPARPPGRAASGTLARNVQQERAT